MVRDHAAPRRTPARASSASEAGNDENAPGNASDVAAAAAAPDPARPPLLAIQPPASSGLKRKPESPAPTPSKLPFRTPEKAAARSRFGWAPPRCEEQPPRAGAGATPYSAMTTPRAHRGKAPVAAASEGGSTQSTPTKSVSKPAYSMGMSGSRPPMSGGGPRGTGLGLGFSTTMGRGGPLSLGPATVVNSAEVPHFKLREDPSFWMDNNVQVNYICCKSFAAISGNYEFIMKLDVESCVYVMYSLDQEEESRRDEKLKYSCKCSFLEIYNEQISDLLDPSSTNLQLREDIRKEVYVENLTESEVGCVSDIIKLLMQGSANRKVAATNMNRESSRSHSVFTCIIESRWEKDSASNLRFARLNLVDLAGSERQRTSGAEGERLKEAANINKSLSTLGLVIMNLVDLAHGKQRHVPYRDSRLTFLLQDSLGGNSKTMIIANVSPSVCSANETLSTLKFAQRARLIQNNEELAVLKRQHVTRSLSFSADIFGGDVNDGSMADNDDNDANKRGSLKDLQIPNMQLRSLEEALAGALRRESTAENTIRELETEIEKLNELVRQREDDTRSAKMMLKFRDEKIHRMDALVNNKLPAESYLLEENKTLSQEIDLLRARLDKNPEVTRFALENIRLSSQLKREISDLEKELGALKISKEEQLKIVENISSSLHQYDFDETAKKEYCSDESFMRMEELLNLQLESDVLKTIRLEERTARTEVEEKYACLGNELQSSNLHILQACKRNEALERELNDLRSVIEASESQEIILINQLDEMKNNNQQSIELLEMKDMEISRLNNELDILRKQEYLTKEEPRTQLLKCYDNEDSPLQTKLKRMQASLEKAWHLNKRYQRDQASHCSAQQEMAEVCRQVEVETAAVIVCLEEELMSVKQELEASKRKDLLAKQSIDKLQLEIKQLNDKLHEVLKKNESLSSVITEKDKEIELLTNDWNILAADIGSCLVDGNAALDEASDQVAFISKSFSHRTWVEEQVQKMCRGISERDELLGELQNRLKEADNIRCDLDLKLMSLRGAMQAINEVHQQEKCDQEKENYLLRSQVSEQGYVNSQQLEQIHRIDLLLDESIERFVQKDVLEQNYVSFHREMEEAIHQLELQLDQSKSYLAHLSSQTQDKDKVDLRALEAFQPVEQKNAEVICKLSKEVEYTVLGMMMVQSQMARQLQENENLKESQRKIKDLRGEVLKLNSEIIEKDRYYEARLKELELKIQGNEASHISWNKEKEALEHEISEANLLVAQKSFESATLIAMFEEAQATISDADSTVKALVKANEKAKHQAERYQENETLFIAEKDGMLSEISSLKTLLDMKEQSYKLMERKFQSGLLEANELALELEDGIRLLQNLLSEKLEFVSSDVKWMKEKLQHFAELARTWLEENWLEIIGKDCAISVLHLCHMGILLERITGLNAENGFLQSGLSESNSLISKLREHNDQAKNELEICSVLKGKLLFDINNSFSRITKKEQEATELNSRIDSFEKKILHLQLQEEAMVQRSNSMYTELSILIQDIDAMKRSALAAESKKKEKLRHQLDEALLLNAMLKDKMLMELNLIQMNSSIPSIDITDCNEFDLCNSLADYRSDLVMTSMITKDIESTVMASELRQHKLYLQEQRVMFADVLEGLMAEATLWKVDQDLENIAICVLHGENNEIRADLENLKQISEEAMKNLHAMKEENTKLNYLVPSLESSIMSFQTNLDAKNKALEELECSHAAVSKELELKTKAINLSTTRENCLSAENETLKQKILNILCKEQSMVEVMATIEVDKSLVTIESRFQQVTDHVDNYVNEQINIMNKLSNELDIIQVSAEELSTQNSLLQSELIRKDELAKGLSFDLSLLQESASVAKDESSELLELRKLIESLEQELASKSLELDDVVSDRKQLEARILKSNENVATLGEELEKKLDELNIVSVENAELKSQLQHLEEISYAMEELAGKSEAIGRLEEELVELRSLIDERNVCFQSLQNDFSKLSDEKQCCDTQLHILKEKLEMAQAFAEESEAIATESRQIAEEQKVYAEEKDEEVKLLERSIEELEDTVCALESKVDIVKEEAERQRMLREELEVELQKVRQQMLTVPPSGNARSHMEDGMVDLADSSRHLTDMHNDLLCAQESIRVLEKEVSEKESEIAQCKAHISELNIHAEAAAREYKQKQMNSEKDEELSAAKQRIVELEGIAASRQREQALADNQKKMEPTESAISQEQEIKEAENSNYKTIILNLEDEVKKLTRQQNLQLRINHHVKTKEENILLKRQNEELSAKLQQLGAILTRTKEELARYRVTNVKDPYEQIEEEELLRKKLDESEQDRSRLAENLSSLCTSILKVAGVVNPESGATLLKALECLNQLQCRIPSLESEVEDLKLKCKLLREKARLSEPHSDSSSLSSGARDGSTPQDLSRSPSISSFR
ncbi:hypothetical protein HU200_003494 [Digitaria exilis]|uniref:Kinesin motor domain-containing protein n=1 Tax=Digitaria exilis TaxID=1010633 RepID=A0A835KYK7_9POAL|nr:hypothetical protein HU200_003494 [Digitaria exilis]